MTLLSYDHPPRPKPIIVLILTLPSPIFHSVLSVTFSEVTPLRWERPMPRKMDAIVREVMHL